MAIGSAAIVHPLFLIGAAHAEPDEDLMGKAENYPVAPNVRVWYQPRCRVGSSSALADVPGMHVNHVAKPARSLPLARAADPPRLAYSCQGQTLSVDDCLNRQRTTSLLVLHHGEIVTEQYRYARSDAHKRLSFSMGKSLTALLLGLAQAKGQIRSLDDKVETYTTSLAGSACGACNIRAQLRMSSGLRFTGVYDGKDDIARMQRA